MLLGHPHVWQPPFVELSVIQQVVTVIPHDSPCMLIPESPGNGCVWKWCVPQITICLGKLWSINGVRCCSHVFFRKKTHTCPINIRYFSWIEPLSTVGWKGCCIISAANGRGSSTGGTVMILVQETGIWSIQNGVHGLYLVCVKQMKDYVNLCP